MSIREYVRKRNFKITSEPVPTSSGKKRLAAGTRVVRGRAGRGKPVRSSALRRAARLRPPLSKSATFVIQEHHARRLHFDLRLELRGVLKSWAVTKEPSTDPSARILAIETEDHPREYAKFSGTIPEGEYGAGEVLIYDRGTFRTEGDLAANYEAGKILVYFRGKKMHGRYELVRIGGEGTRSRWLFFKTKPKIRGLKVTIPKKQKVRI
jgi:bifunctional non-homologous end joining protein LigD